MLHLELELLDFHKNSKLNKFPQMSSGGKDVWDACQIKALKTGNYVKK